MITPIAFTLPGRDVLVAANAATQSFHSRGNVGELGLPGGRCKLNFASGCFDRIEAAFVSRFMTLYNRS